MVAVIRDICILYDDEQASKIEDIKNVIDNNYNLFLNLMGSSRILSFIPTDDENTVYVSDFEETFFEMADQIFNSDSIKKSVQDTDVLIAFYIEFLTRQCADNSKALLQPNPSVSDEMLYALIAYKYFRENGSFNDFVEYLKYRKDTDKIIRWLQNEIRYEVYNYLLSVAVSHLKENDFEFLENMSNVIVKILDQSLDDILDNKKSKIEKLSSISLEELDSLFYEFLDYINAPDNWKQLYDELKQDNKISFEKRVDDTDYSKCYKDTDGVLKILISFDGTIDSFCSFVHEFVHYLSLCDETVVPKLSLIEFPSVFFEKIAAEFLKNKGYKNNVVDNVIGQRKQNNRKIYLELSSLFSDIARFINYGAITKADKVEYWKNNFKLIQEAKEEAFKRLQESNVVITQDMLDLLKPSEVNIDDGVDEECDDLIESFIYNGILILDGYQYLLDTLLADEVLSKAMNDPSIIVKMVEITDKLGNFNLNDILIYFGMEDLFGDTKRSSSVKSKKLHL